MKNEGHVKRSMLEGEAEVEDTLYEENAARQAHTQDAEVLDAEEVDVVRRMTTAPHPANIVPVGEARIVPSMSPAEIRKAVDDFLAYAVELDRLKIAMLKLTSHHDWVAHAAEDDPHGVPYLQSSGCRKIKKAFGIEMRIFPSKDGDLCRRIDYRDEGAHTFEYIMEGVVRSRSIDSQWTFIVGSRWSGDGIFSRGGQIRVDPGDVRKSAQTNFDNRAIKQVLGLENIEWDDLEQYAGIKRSHVKVVDVSSKGQGKGGKGKASGDKAAISKGPHINIYLEARHGKFRDWIKKQDLWNYAGEEKPPYWQLPFTADHYGAALDMQAEDSTIKVETGNVDEKDLP
jgi:hypothetical protein